MEISSPNSINKKSRKMKKKSLKDLGFIIKTYKKSKKVVSKMYLEHQK